VADGNARGLDDEALRRLCLALAPLLACSLDLRSSGCEPRVPGETAARETPTERAIDAGQLAAARAAEARVIRCGRSTECLRWLAEHGGPAATVASMSQCLAEQWGPIALREALPAATAAARKAEEGLQHAQQRAATVRATPTVEWIAKGGAEVSRARGNVESARARETAARAALVAWGGVRLEAAHAAWYAVGDSSD
jgi:hypothetical protein